MVYMGVWGVSSAVGLASSNPASDRQPAYLFSYAPTSFGWRDLLLSTNVRYTEERMETLHDGRVVRHVEFKPEYQREITTMNKAGPCWWLAGSIRSSCS